MQKSEKIEDYIFRNIKAGRWKSGDKLPSEKEMCSTLNVSEVTLRIALKTLANRGIIKRKRGAGSYVSHDFTMNKIVIFAKIESFAYNTGYIYRMIANNLKNIIMQNGMLPELIISDGKTIEEIFDNLQFERRNDLHEIAGAISLCSCSPGILRTMKKYHIPLVNIAGQPLNRQNTKETGNFVYLSGYASVQKGAEILRAAGVTDFAMFYVNGSPQLSAIPQKTYHHDILTEFGLPADNRHWVEIPGEWDRHSAYQAFANWLDLSDRPSVAFFLEDNICTQALYTIWERHIKIPDDLQILTSSSGQYFHSPVPLTRLELDTNKIASLLFNSVIALVRGEKVDFPILVSAEYKPGESLLFANSTAVPIAKVIEKTVARPAVLPGQSSPWKTECDYCFAEGNEKFEVWSDITGQDRYDNFRNRFSDDNGVTWGNSREVFQSQNKNGNIRRWCELFQNLEINSNSVYRMYMDGVYENDNDTKCGTESFQKNHFIAVQRSFNGGKSFTAPENITDFYRKHYGNESDQLMLSCSHLCSLDNGSFAVPLCLQRQNSNMTGIMLIGHTVTHAGVCRTEWKFSEPLELADKYKDYHLTEGTVAALPDGRLLAVYRSHLFTQNASQAEKWVKFYAVSNDNGMTWSKPCIMRYADGRNLCSPSSMARLVMHKSGRLFMIGNIYGMECAEDIKPEQSRNQLAMIEIDTVSLLPLAETLTVIAKRTANMNENTALSNFSVSVDRESGDILLSVPTVYANRMDLSDCCLVNYRVKIED